MRNARWLWLLLILAGCTGTLRLGGWVPIRDDDDSSSDDDDASDDDDLTPSDDDDAADDDDATIAGGDVFCGLDLASPGGSDLTAVTGDADLDVDYGDGGPEFEATWTGCEARHYWTSDGDYVCGIRWDVDAEAYVTQRQASALVMRFRMDLVESNNTCFPGHPAGGDRTVYTRLRVPYDDGELTLLRDDEPNTPPSNMADWAEVPWVGQGDEPEVIDFAYSTEFSAGAP